VARGALVVLAFVACSVDGGGRGESLTFGSDSAGTMTTSTGSTDEGSSTGASTSTTDDGADTGSTSAPSTDTSGAIEASSGDDDGAAACPPVDPLDCSPGPGNGKTCDLDGVSCFLPTVQASVQGIVNGHPEWFDMSAGTPFVLEPELYMDAVVADVSAAGLCAIRDPNAGDEIAVKHDNAYAESFDILSAEGNARWGEGIYTATCAPSWF
jgi:hypothetical protein